MTYPIGGQFNIGSCYVPYSTLGTSYGNPYQTSMFGRSSTSSSTGMDMSSMMSFMMQMKQLEAMNQTTTNTSNTIAESSSSGYDTTEVGNFEVECEEGTACDVDAFRDFMNNQNTASTLYIKGSMTDFASSLILALNEEADFTTNTEKISLSRALNALGISLTPVQVDQLAMTVGIEHDADLDANSLQKVLTHLGFKSGENNRYNLNFEMERAITKINNNTSYKIKGFGDKKNEMDTEEFLSTFEAFKDVAPANAKLSYGSLDNLAKQLTKASKTVNGVTEITTLDALLNNLGIDAGAMSDQEKQELLYKAGVTTVGDPSEIKSLDGLRSVPGKSAAPKAHDNWISNGGYWAMFGNTVGSMAAGAAAGAVIGSVIPVVGTVAGIVIGSVIGLAGGITHKSVEEGHEDVSETLRNKYRDAKPVTGEGSGIGLNLNPEDLNTRELSTDDVKKILIALGFGETSVSKAEFEQALETDIKFTKGNIKDSNGNNIFDTFLNNLKFAQDSESDRNTQDIDILVNTILKSDETVKQAAIEAFFTDFPDFVDEFITRTIDTSDYAFDKRVTYSVYNTHYFFQAAQDLINATTDPGKKARYKVAYNAGVERLAQLEGLSAMNVSDEDMAAKLRKNLQYSGSELTDNTTGYAGYSNTNKA